GVALAQGLPLVVLLLAAGDAELELHPPALEVEHGGDERHPVLVLRGLELVDLRAMQQELAGALLVVAQKRMRQRRNAHALDVRLAALDLDPGLADVGRALAQRARLAADERDPGFEAL